MSETEKAYNLIAALRFHKHPLTQQAADRIEELESELADLKEGRTAIIPHSRDHAEKLLFMAEVFWNGNAHVVGWKNRENKGSEVGKTTTKSPDTP